MLQWRRTWNSRCAPVVCVDDPLLRLLDRHVRVETLFAGGGGAEAVDRARYASAEASRMSVERPRPRITFSRVLQLDLHLALGLLAAGDGADAVVAAACTLTPVIRWMAE